MATLVKISKNQLVMIYFYSFARWTDERDLAQKWSNMGRAADGRDVRIPLCVPRLPDMVWSVDFMSDALACGRRFRTFNVVDDFNREVLHEVDRPATD